MRIKSQIKINSMLRNIFILIIFSSVLSFSQDCTGSAAILTNNPFVGIYIDSAFVGKGEAKINLGKGNHYLLIKDLSFKWGAPVISDTIRITECGKDYKFTYDMNKKDFSSAQPNIFEYVNKKENFFSTTTFKILLGSAALLGGVTAYYKNKADKKYADYLITKNSSTLDEVDRLDLYSGVAFGLLQFNFGYLIYKFLTD